MNCARVVLGNKKITLRENKSMTKKKKKKDKKKQRRRTERERVI